MLDSEPEPEPGFSEMEQRKEERLSILAAFLGLGISIALWVAMDYFGFGLPVTPPGI